MTRRFFGLVLGLATIACAQTPAAPEQAQQRFEKIKERLELSPEQAEQVRPVFVEEMQQLRAVREKYSGASGRRDRLRMARELRGVQDQADEKLKKILTKKQMDELKKVREEARREFRERSGR